MLGTESNGNRRSANARTSRIHPDPAGRLRTGDRVLWRAVANGARAAHIAACPAARAGESLGKNRCGDRGPASGNGCHLAEGIDLPDGIRDCANCAGPIGAYEPPSRRARSGIAMEITPDHLVLLRWGLVQLNATIVYTWAVMLLLVLPGWLVTRKIRV